MKILLPSDSETGSLSYVSKEFETSRYYTVAEIIDGTVASTQVRQGFPSPPPAERLASIVRNLKIDAVVLDSASPDTIGSLRSSGIRVITGAKGLVGMLIDWIANLGIDGFEIKIALLNRPAPAPAKPAAPAAPPAPAAAQPGAKPSAPGTPVPQKSKSS
ncbi:MAG: hypothetical protein KIY12_02130 [Thermoplasmata archaeon]|uniref:NifB/NifX family molybdenum-iron cluster-binding protein n=1 Tax=Candidatus Sysuiplasma superficiale TaxID=2823368 RepID=A0A8J8CCQ5_9ARCH|nr:NifB/NifX family molybdenum-iron cluster-binding protein [Candidatus Sysuiplasma superficiale]MBX8643516.1 hypothetical protein [Candidatus Sysuiplasma superficiale]